VRRALAPAALVALIVAACSSDDTGGTATTTTSSSVTTGTGVMTPAESCVQPGDVGNEQGVGTPCTPFGGECAAFPGTAAFCLADIGPELSDNQWFCTRTGCDEHPDCGEGAGCLIEGAGSACVPCRCDDRGIGCGGEGGAGGAGGGTGGAGGAGTGGAGGAGGG
jgi:hypothetical protein